MTYAKDQVLLGVLRILMGWLFLWAFVDKLFGWGFATAPANAWIRGGSPTYGFLANSPKGPLKEIFNAMAGSGFVEWLFMLGLLGIGVALMLGIGTKIAGYSGALLMLLMWLAVLPPKQNPFLDDHIMYLIILLLFTRAAGCGTWIGLGKWWRRRGIVRKYSWLE